MKKKLLSLLLASTMALPVTAGLAACGGGTKITVWCPDGAVECYTKLVEEFKKANEDAKNWKVTFEKKGEGDSLTALQTDIKTGPEVFFFASDHIPTMLQNKLLQPLPDDYVKAVKARDAAGAIAPVTADNKVWAFPNVNSNGYFLIYDTTVFTAEDVKSLDTMITVAGEKNKNIMFAYGNGFYNCSMFFGMGVGLGDTGHDLKVELKTDKGYEAGKTFLKYFGTGESGVFVDMKENSSPSVAFKEESIGAAISGTWCNENGYMDKMLEEKGWSKDRIAYTQLPKFTGTDGKTYQMGSFMGAKYCGVNPSKDPAVIEASLRLADYFNNEAGQVARFNATQEAPTNTKAADNADVKTNKMLVALAAQNAAGGVPQIKVPDDYWDSMGAFGGGIYKGEITSSNITTKIDALHTSLGGK